MRKGVLFVCMIAMLIGCSGEFDSLVDKGDDKVEEGDFEEALTFYEKALEEKRDEDVQRKADHIHTYIDVQAFIDDEEWADAEDAVGELGNKYLQSTLGQAVREQMQVIHTQRKAVARAESLTNEIEALLETENIIDQSRSLYTELREDTSKDVLAKEKKELSEAIGEKERTIKKRENQEKAKATESEAADSEETEDTADDKKEKEKDGKKDETATKESFPDKKEEFSSRIKELEQEDERSAENSDGVTAHTRERLGDRTEAWDIELNKVYQFLMENSDQADAIRAEQREWLEDREEKADEIYSHPAGGTMQLIEGDQYYLDSTRDRTKELVDEYM